MGEGRAKRERVCVCVQKKAQTEKQRGGNKFESPIWKNRKLKKEGDSVALETRPSMEREARGGRRRAGGKEARPQPVEKATKRRA